MPLIPFKDPGPGFSLADARGGQLRMALASGRRGVSASHPGGQIAVAQVRGKYGIPTVPDTQPSLRTRRITGAGSFDVPRFSSVPVCGQSAVEAPPDMWPSQMNLHDLKRYVAPYGRQLRGFGMLPHSFAHGDTWAGSDPSLLAAAEADDSVGNGIFDGAGAPPTAHAGSGVFESHFAMPGYLYRERPTSPSEIRDTTTGMPVVYMPDAGGSWYDDVVDAYRSFDRETPRLYQRGRPVMKVLPSLMGLGESAAPTSSTDTLKVWALWGAMGMMAALGATLAYKSIRGY